MSTLTRRHVMIVLALLLAFSAVFTVTAPRAAQAAAAKPITVALGFAGPCTPGSYNVSNNTCDCPSGYVSQGLFDAASCVAAAVVPAAAGQGVTDVAGTTNQTVASTSACPLYADTGLKIPAKNTDGSAATLLVTKQWPQKPTIDPNVDLVSVVGQALYTSATCFNDVRTAVISADKKTLTIYKGGLAWKTLTAPTGETFTSAVFNNGLVVTFNNPNGAKPDNTALLNAIATQKANINTAYAAANATAYANAAAKAASAAARAANAANAAVNAANFNDAAAYAAYAANAAADAAAVATINAKAAANATAYANTVAKAADAAAYAKAAAYANTAAKAADDAAKAAKAAAKAAQDFVTAWQNNFTPTVTYSIDQINAWSNA